MKKYYLVVGLILISSAIKAQIIIALLLGDKLNSGKVDFGLEGGINFSDIANLDHSKSLNKFNLGFYFDIKLKNPSWMFNTGVHVKNTTGADDLPVYALGDPALDSAFKGGKIARKINYFYVPVMIKYRFKNNFYVKGGIQLGLKYKAFDEFKKSVHDEDDLKYKVEIKDDFYSIDAGLTAGLGYHISKGNGMQIGAKYYYGLVNIVTKNSLPNQFNRIVYVTVCIPVGKNKQKKKAEKKEITSP